MGLVSGIVVYICIWWTVIFCTLPLWVKHEESENGTKPEEIGPGAPDNPYIKRKIILTTLVSAVLWLVIYACIHWEIIDFREIAAKWYEIDYN